MVMRKAGKAAKSKVTVAARKASPKLPRAKTAETTEAGDEPKVVAKTKAKRKPKVAPVRGSASAFPVLQRPPLPSKLRGELPAGQAFDDLALGASFRYRGAVERGFNELWIKRDDMHYSAAENDESILFRRPDGAAVLPA